jgi:hypothetical protein
MNHYNHIYADGKWNHFMDQTHLGYKSWMPPRKNNLDAIDLKEIEPLAKATMGISISGTEQSWPGSSEKAILPELDVFNNSKQYIEIFNRGNMPFDYKITSNVSWLTFSDTNGQIDKDDKRIWIKLDQTKVPIGNSEGIITIKGANEEVAIAVKAFKPVNNSSIKGFVESGGVIAIEAEHFSKNKEVGESKWIKIEDYGLTLSGMRATAPAHTQAAIPNTNAPCLEYPVYLFSKDSIDVTLISSPLLNFMPERDFKLAVSFDDEEPQCVTNVPKVYKIDYSNLDWSKSVVDQARRTYVSLKVPQAGFHTLKVWMIDPGIVLEKIIINTGGLKSSYLGPNEGCFK